MMNNDLGKLQNTKEYEKNAMVLKLERHQNDLSQLRNKLNSYICEPKTPVLFERMESLKLGLEQLRTDNATIIKNIRLTKKMADDSLEHIKRQFLAFHSMRNGVEEYIRGARNC